MCRRLTEMYAAFQPREQDRAQGLPIDLTRHPQVGTAGIGFERELEDLTQLSIGKPEVADSRCGGGGGRREKQLEQVGWERALERPNAVLVGGNTVPLASRVG